MIYSLLKCLPLLIYFGCFVIQSSEAEKGQEPKKIGCQQKSTMGRDYLGEANTTVDGISCRRWSDPDLRAYGFAHVGDHNFCRNPKAVSQFPVWCFTPDPDTPHQICSVPFCSPLKALDFSLDSDSEPDESANYTHASLQQKKTYPLYSPSAQLSW